MWFVNMSGREPFSELAAQVLHDAVLHEETRSKGFQLLPMMLKTSADDFDAPSF